MEEELREIGLSPSEIKAYLSLLELGSSTNGQVAKEAKIDRSNCNEAIKRLVEKGLVSYVIKANRKYFEATNPSHILELLKEKAQKIEGIIPLLEQKQSAFKKEQEANIYEGYKGVKSVFEDILKTLGKNDEYLVFGAISVPTPFENFINHWTKLRIKKGIKLKIIYNEEAKNMIKRYKDEKLTETKTLPKEYITPAVVNIYGNKTATIVWTKEPLVFVVKNKEYANSFRNYFNLLWKISK